MDEGDGRAAVVVVCEGGPTTSSDAQQQRRKCMRPGSSDPSVSVSRSVGAPPTSSAFPCLSPIGVAVVVIVREQAPDQPDE